MEGDAALLERLADPAYQGKPEQAIVFRVEAWDENCSQHIPQRFDAAAARAATRGLEARVAALEAENRELRLGRGVGAR